jgi:hypothetical protein
MGGFGSRQGEVLIAHQQEGLFKALWDKSIFHLYSLDSPDDFCAGVV